MVVNSTVLLLVSREDAVFFFFCCVVAECSQSRCSSATSSGDTTVCDKPLYLPELMACCAAVVLAGQCNLLQTFSLQTKLDRGLTEESDCLLRPSATLMRSLV
jgi:hypothetical protein